MHLLKGFRSLLTNSKIFAFWFQDGGRGRRKVRGWLCGKGQVSAETQLCNLGDNESGKVCRLTAKENFPAAAEL